MSDPGSPPGSGRVPTPADGLHGNVGLERFTHLVGWWIELTPGREWRRWTGRRGQMWEWMLKRPDPTYPFGFAVSGSGEEWSRAKAVKAAIDKAAWFEDRKAKREQTERIDL